MISRAPLLFGKAIRPLAFCGMVCLFTGQSYAQTTNDAVYLQQIEAVYGTDFFTEKPELKANFVVLLRDRISYIQLEYVNPDKYEWLSSVPMNPLVTADQAVIDPATFSPESFNPLLYSMNLFEWNLVKIYRIDGTDYYIVIQPQNAGK